MRTKKNKIKKRFYRSVWISDVHLCTKDAQSGMLYAFLNHIRCDYLYLVGDIIDIWALQVDSELVGALAGEKDHA